MFIISKTKLRVQNIIKFIFVLFLPKKRTHCDLIYVITDSINVGVSQSYILNAAVYDIRQKQSIINKYTTLTSQMTNKYLPIFSKKRLEYDFIYLIMNGVNIGVSQN